MAEQNQYDERVVQINRVAKVVKGGRRFSFTALCAVGDGNGRVGIGYGKAKVVPAGIPKGSGMADRAVLDGPVAGSRIRPAVVGEPGASRLLIRPAAAATLGMAVGGARPI